LAVVARRDSPPDNRSHAQPFVVSTGDELSRGDFRVRPTFTFSCSIGANANTSESDSLESRSCSNVQYENEVLVNRG
jgi:hypothetical protein